MVDLSNCKELLEEAINVFLGELCEYWWRDERYECYREVEKFVDEIYEYIVNNIDKLPYAVRSNAPEIVIESKYYRSEIAKRKEYFVVCCGEIVERNVLEDYYRETPPSIASERYVAVYVAKKTPTVIVIKKYALTPSENWRAYSIYYYDGQYWRDICLLCVIEDYFIDKYHKPKLNSYKK